MLINDDPILTFLVALGFSVGLAFLLAVIGAKKPSPGDVTVTGRTSNPHSGTPVSVIVKAPNGNIASSQQVAPNPDGTFEAAIKHDSQLMKSSGDYTVVAQHGSASSEITIRYLG